ncbi:hypothetical protein [Streptomyces lancefieldiae]|uniref:Integral membrane protein n=1 Tax=Streptomyces lancefieldiae TaxID=3075520 RepID=A0ABU3AIP3_9ACTN|nr:hypothetical protein [Streptomyces sp. DSM 40712]MDT0609798.1 hypothetical protein [Streptomyces sp. DSM 40712]
MEQRQAKVSHRLVSGVVAAVAASALWAAWLGWDQQRDVQPDGSTTGPYEVWQVVGLVLTLLVPVCWAAYRRHAVGAVLGVTAGLTAAAFYDWSDDSSGLFVVGVGMVMVGALAVTTGVTAAVTGLIAAVGRKGGAVTGL